MKASKTLSALLLQLVVFSVSFSANFSFAQVNPQTINVSQFVPAPLQASVSGYRINSTDIIFDFQTVTFESESDVRQFVQNFQAQVNTQNELDAPLSIQHINSDQSSIGYTESTTPEFNVKSVADQISAKIPSATVDAISFSKEQSAGIWAKAKSAADWVAPKKESIQISIMKATFTGIRIGTNTYKQYTALVLSHYAPAALTLHSLSVFVGCSLSAITARHVNNYVMHGTFTSNDQLAQETQAKRAEKLNEIKIWTAIQNFHSSPSESSKYFRFMISEALFVGFIKATDAIIDLALNVKMDFSAENIAITTFSTATAIGLSTLSQGSSEVAIGTWREWAKVKGLSSLVSEFFTSAGLASASVLSVTGALYVASGHTGEGLIYLGALGLFSKVATKVFNYSMKKSTTCKDLLTKTNLTEAHP